MFVLRVMAERRSESVNASSTALRTHCQSSPKRV